MRKTISRFAGLVLSALLFAPMASSAQEAVDSGMTIYFQMGGNPGDTATLARELGARDAARVLKVKLIEQHAGWDPQKMLTQASEALAAQPDAIVVMGHPGTDAMTSFIGKAKAAKDEATAAIHPLRSTSRQIDRVLAPSAQARAF